MKWASALSRDVDVAPAVARAVDEVRRGLDGAQPDLLLAFLNWSYARDAEEVSGRLRSAFPQACLLGCTGGGVIGAGHEAEDVPAVSLTAASLPGVSVAPFHTTQGGLSLAPHAACLILADPFTSDPLELLAELDGAHPEAVKVGGLASGGTSPGSHRLWVDGDVLHSGAAGVVLSGALRVDVLVAQGCRPVGPPMFATRVEENLLMEVDRRSPLDVLRAIHQAACPDDRRRIQHSLHIGVSARGSAPRDDGQADLVVRNVVGIDESRRALAVGAELKQYDVVQFMLRDAQAAREDLVAALARSREEDPTPPAGALLFSCTGRGRYLFGCADHDTTLFTEAFGPTPLGGFFCNGEIGPVGARTWLHGYTSAFALFRSRH